MTLKLTLSGNKQCIISNAYPPTMTDPDEKKEKFHDDLFSIISATLRIDKIFLLGDCNARVNIIFSFWSFEISDGILRNRTLMIGLHSFS